MFPIQTDSLNFQHPCISNVFALGNQHQVLQYAFNRLNPQTPTSLPHLKLSWIQLKDFRSHVRYSSFPEDDFFVSNKSKFSLSETQTPQEEALKIEPYCSRSQVKEEVIAKKEEPNDDGVSIIYRNHQLNKLKIKNLVTYILDNVGQVKETDLNQERLKYAEDPILVELFDILLDRYSTTYKTKDEILKYITRKAFTVIRKDYKQKNYRKGETMSETLCKRYFKSSLEQIRELGIDINDRENFLQVLFPYRKNCKNKTRYKGLIEKIGTSKEFYEDYSLFLESFTEIIQNEKEKKVDSFVSFLSYCISKKQLNAIIQYKRLPWLDKWIKFAEITAKGIGITLKLGIESDPFEKKKTTFRKKNKLNEEKIQNKDALDDCLREFEIPRNYLAVVF